MTNINPCDFDQSKREKRRAEPSDTTNVVSSTGLLTDWNCDWNHLGAEWVGNVTYTMRMPRRFPSQWLGVVSSHSYHTRYAESSWQACLSSAVLLAKRQSWGVLVAMDAPYSTAITHHCQRMDVPLVQLFVHKSHIEAASDRTASLVIHSDSQVHSRLSDDDWSKIPIHDRLCVLLAHRIFALDVKKHGRIARLLAKRLCESSFPPASVYVSCIQEPSSKPSALSSSAANTDWMRAGAIGWIVRDDKAHPSHSNEAKTATIHHLPPCSHRTALNSVINPILPLQMISHDRAGELFCENRFLVHCTRARRGPWPDQSLDQFHDEILNQPWESQPSPFETLLRILRQQRLIATKRLKRGDLETISFSDRPLHEVLDQRRFQSHLSRWDWEPFGIIIERDWLIAQGARQVRYVPIDQLASIPNTELPYIQPIRLDESKQDWRTEQEWRHPHDLRLSSIPFNKAMVFVSNLAEARFIQHISRWPIVYRDK